MSGKGIAGAFAVALLTVAGTTAAAQAADPESCKAVRVADGGWTDNTAQNGVLTTILKGLGYEPKTNVLAVPIILEGMKGKDVDIWLDNWMPSQTAEVSPYLKDKTVDTVAANLEGAGYGPAVLDDAAAAGVKDLSDLHKFKEQFDGKIYGIEPGNDGNRILQAAIDNPANNLQGWELVESSEQGMLSQVERARKDKKWIIFLAWAPHPVMSTLPLRYLSGFEKDGFGPSTVHTLTRANYVTDCPNVGRLLKNLKFSMALEGSIMEAILAGTDGEVAGKDWLKKNPGDLDAWLKDVTTFEGKDGLPAVKASLGLN